MAATPGLLGGCIDIDIGAFPDDADDAEGFGVPAPELVAAGASPSTKSFNAAEDIALTSEPMPQPPPFFCDVSLEPFIGFTSPNPIVDGVGIASGIIAPDDVSFARSRCTPRRVTKSSRSLTKFLLKGRSITVETGCCC